MLKKILIVALKHAINAAIITGGPLIWDSGHFNFHSSVSFLSCSAGGRRSRGPRIPRLGPSGHEMVQHE